MRKSTAQWAYTWPLVVLQCRPQKQTFINRTIGKKSVGISTILLQPGTTTATHEDKCALTMPYIK